MGQTRGWNSIPAKDKWIVTLLVFFLSVAFSLELYWIVYADSLVARSHTDWIAYLYSIYGEADRAYFDSVTPFTLGLETINVFVSQILNVWLIWAILAEKRYRYALQLTVGSFLTYSVVLYFWVFHLAEYADMQYQSAYTFIILIVPNLPWLLGYLYLAWDAYRAIIGQQKQKRNLDPITR